MGGGGGGEGLRARGGRRQVNNLVNKLYVRPLDRNGQLRFRIHYCTIHLPRRSRCTQTYIYHHTNHRCRARSVLLLDHDRLSVIHFPTNLTLDVSQLFYVTNLVSTRINKFRQTSFLKFVNGQVGTTKLGAKLYLTFKTKESVLKG